MFSRHHVLGLATSLVLLLSACGSTPLPTTEKPGVVTPSFTVSAAGPASASQVGDTIALRVTITPAGGASGPYSVGLSTPLRGVEASPVSVNVDGVTTVTLPVKVVSAAGVLRFSVTVSGSGTSHSDDAYAFVYGVRNLPSDIATCRYPACNFSAGAAVVANGSYWAGSKPNQGNDSTLIRVPLNGAEPTSYNLGLGQYDSVYGIAVTASKTWVGVSSQLSIPAVLLGLDPATGTTERTEVKIPAGQQGIVLNMVTLPDQRVAFLHEAYPQGAGPSFSLGVFDPVSRQVSLTPVDGFLFSLSVGPDGQVWTTTGYKDPALLRFDPKTLGITRFSIGTENTNLALGVAATADGNVWFHDSRTSTIGILNPVTGMIRRFGVSGEAGLLYASDVNVYFVQDHEALGKTRVGFLSLENNRLANIAFPTARGQYEDLSGFAVGADDSLGYLSSGQAYILPVK